MRVQLAPLLVRGLLARVPGRPASRGLAEVAAGQAASWLRRYATQRTADTGSAQCRPNFSVVPCSCCDEDRVMDFMKHTFYREEPILVAVGLAGCPPKVLLDHTRASFREGLSLMAILPDQQDKICGVAINSIVGPADACKMRHLAEQMSCLATRHVLELWSLMLEGPEIWCDQEQDQDGVVGCMLELRELATDPDQRGHGVGLQLALASREVAVNVGAPSFKIDCTSYYSAKVAEKLDMKKALSLRYADIVDASGKPVFQPPCPHEEAAVYIQKLSKDCQHKFGGEY